jgi:hypothetical protein
VGVGAKLNALGAFVASCWRVLAAYTKRLRPQWPFLVFTVGFTVLAIVNTQRSASEQIALPAATWGLIALGCLSIAQFFLWRSMWVDPVEGSHEQRLRDIARGLKADNEAGNEPRYTDGISGDPILKRMFEAHYRDAATLIDRSRKATLRAFEARNTLRGLVTTEAAVSRFPQDEGWKPWSVADCARTHLEAILAREEMRLDSPSKGDTLSWPSMVIWDVPDAPSGAVDEAKGHLLSWVTEIADSAEAKAVHREAGNVDRTRAAAREALEPILHDAPIKKARRCEICFPR